MIGVTAVVDRASPMPGSRGGRRHGPQASNGLGRNQGWVPITTPPGRAGTPLAWLAPPSSTGSDVP